MSELVRNYAFWCLDFVKGSYVRNHLRDLQKAFSDPAGAKEMAEQRLKKLLDHACKTTEFYKKFGSLSKLEDFPVIQKRVILENYEKFFSSLYEKKSLFPVTTSGSYGTPFTFYLTKEKKTRQWAEVIFFGRWSGYDIGLKHAYIKSTRAKSFLKLFMQNEILMAPFNVDKEWIKQQSQKLHQKDVNIIIGYSSVIGEIAKYCQEIGEGPDKFAIKSVITSSEVLYDDVRDIIERTFGCKAVSRYSTEELGVVAQERPGEHEHVINIASYVVEILDMHKDIPAKTGEPGRIIITDLFSHAMPLIRYDIGDLGAISSGSRNQIPVFTKLEGRKVESIYNPSGALISAFAINGAFRDQQNIIQFQFIQKGRCDYVLKLVVLDSFKEEQIIRDRIMTLLGSQANLKILFVDLIPPLPSGKRPYIINEYNKTYDH